LKRKPKLITVDFSGSWDGPIEQVFPGSKIQRCEFHAIQLLNRAILKDLTGFGRERFASQIKELRQFSRCLKKEMPVKKMRKTKWTCKPVLNSLPHYVILRKLKRIKDVTGFTNSFFGFLRKLNEGKSQFDLFFAEELTRRLPINGLTAKNLKYFKKKIFQAQRKVLRVFREQIEGEKKRFSECRFLLLTRPERLSARNQEILTQFLSDYPEFQKYRDLSLDLGEIFRLTSRRQAEKRLKNLEIWEDAHLDLKAAIKTLKTHHAELLRFHEVVASNEELNSRKGIRCVAEYQMRAIKKLYRAKFGFRTKKNTRLYLQGVLNCHTYINF